MAFSAIGFALADEKDALRIDRDELVVYCDATWPADAAHVSETLRSGIDVTVIWHLALSRSRQYWLDEKVADIEIVRRVRPDLLSRRWILEDRSTGIMRSVNRLEEAMAFLTELRHYPLVDRSLLRSGQVYDLEVSLQSFDGKQMAGWWRRVLRGDDFSARLSFREP